MASVIPDGGGGDMGGDAGGVDGGDAGGDDGAGGGKSLDVVGSFWEVDNWLGTGSYATQAGLKQPEAAVAQSSLVPGCSMGGRYGETLA